ncbi:MAG: hypothetical protein R6U20_10525 [Longimonas sp.]
MPISVARSGRHAGHPERVVLYLYLPLTLQNYVCPYTVIPDGCRPPSVDDLGSISQWMPMDACVWDVKMPSNGE